MRRWVGAGFTPAQNDQNPTAAIARIGATASVAPTTMDTHIDDRAQVNRAPTIGDIVGTYKSLVANDSLEQFKLNRPNEMMGKLWHRNYHEHIIRDEQSYQRISDYIINNPAKWTGDKFYFQS